MGSRLLLWLLPVAVLGVMVAVTLVPAIRWEPTRPETPVTRSRPVDVRRDRDVRFSNEYLYDSSYETCDALGIDTLARKLRVRPIRASRVARAFAEQNYAAAIRTGPYQGCVDALRDQARHPRGPARRAARRGTPPGRTR
jgi:hypothetical protein